MLDGEGREMVGRIADLSAADQLRVTEAFDAIVSRLYQRTRTYILEWRDPA